MLPAVTEVVLVDEPVVFGMEPIAKAYSLLIVRLAHAEEVCAPVVGAGGMIGIPLKAEGLQMAIGPAEGDTSREYLVLLWEVFDSLLLSTSQECPGPENAMKAKPPLGQLQGSFLRIKLDSIRLSRIQNNATNDQTRHI